MKKDKRTFFNLPKKVKLWEINSDNIIKTPDPYLISEVDFSKTGTILDIGSSLIRAGFSHDLEPRLISNNFVSKSKKSKKRTILVGNMLNKTDFMKSSIKCPMDKGLITSFSLFEHACDYIFQSLGFSGQRINSDLVYSEAFSAPLNHRKTTLELFFECYGVLRALPVVSPLIDGFELPTQPQKPQIDGIDSHPINTGLIIHLGYTTTTVIPFFNGEAVSRFGRRINIGTKQIYEFLCREITLKYDHLSKHLDHHNLTLLFENFIHCAYDYEAQLRYYRDGIAGFKSSGYCHPLVSQYNRFYLKEGRRFLREPLYVEFYESELEKKLQEEELERKRLLRIEQSKRIKEAILKKKEEKRIQNEEDLRDYEATLEEIEAEDDDEIIMEILANKDFDSVDSLKSTIKKIKIKLGLISKEEIAKDKYSLVNIPDSELNPHQLKVKRLQIMQKQSAEKRILEKKKREKQLQDQERMKKDHPEQYKKQLYDKRKILKDKLKKMRSYREDNLLRKKRQQRLLSILDIYCDGKSVNDKKIEREFLKVTEELNEGGSGIEDIENQLNEVEIELRDVDSEFEDESVKYANLFRMGSLIEFGADSIRPVEILFKPYLIGEKKMGLIELIMEIVSLFDKEVRNTLLSNIRLTGAGCRISGFCERLKKEMKSNLTDETLEVTVSVTDDPIISPWQSMSHFYNRYARKAGSEIWITKAEFEEYGVDSIVKNYCYGNFYVNNN